uniref:Uncharacterized protein n=1 Tax=Arundo donax TaxID=35708 RepID=A0A0A9EUM6_ARUDO
MVQFIKHCFPLSTRGNVLPMLCTPLP